MNSSLEITGKPASLSSGRRVAIITGGSHGIGAGLVSGFRREGYAVVATSRSIGAADEDDYVTVRGDIAEAQTARNVVEQALNRFARIDCLVNNAGVFIGKPFTDYTLDEYALITSVNLAGFFHLTQFVIGLMATQGCGHVVNVTRRGPLPRTGHICHRRDTPYRRGPSCWTLTHGAGTWTTRHYAHDHRFRARGTLIAQ